jgi:hypothetical protein
MIQEVDLISTSWYLKNSCPDLEDEVITLSQNNELLGTGNPREEQSWRIRDYTLILSFNNGYSIYTGTITDDRYYGTAENILGEKWTFEAFLIGNKSVIL